MNMIHHRFPLDDIHLFPLAQIFQDLHDAFFVFVVDHLTPVFRREHKGKSLLLFHSTRLAGGFLFWAFALNSLKRYKTKTADTGYQG